MPDRFGRTGLESMGSHLSNEMPGEIVTIAAAFTPGDHEGPDNRYFDDVLAHVGLDLFILDLRRVPAKSSAARWLNREHRTYSQDADILFTPGQTFDAVYFINAISKTTLNPASKRNLAEMRKKN